MSENILSGDEALFLDRKAIYHIGIPRLILMENAGRSVAEYTYNINTKHSLISAPVGVVCGSGNNAGDGFVAARYLYNFGVDVKVFLLAQKKKYQGDSLTNLLIAEKMKIPIEIIRNTKKPR